MRSAKTVLRVANPGIGKAWPGLVVHHYLSQVTSTDRAEPREALNAYFILRYQRERFPDTPSWTGSMQCNLLSFNGDGQASADQNTQDDTVKIVSIRLSSKCTMAHDVSSASVAEPYTSLLCVRASSACCLFTELLLPFRIRTIILHWRTRNVGGFQYH